MRAQADCGAVCRGNGSSDPGSLHQSRLRLLHNQRTRLSNSILASRMAPMMMHEEDDYPMMMTHEDEGTPMKKPLPRAHPMNIATISSGFEKGDFLVREEQGKRLYFDFFEDVSSIRTGRFWLYLAYHCWISHDVFHCG